MVSRIGRKCEKTPLFVGIFSDSLDFYYSIIERIVNDNSQLVGCKVLDIGKKDFSKAGLSSFFVSLEREYVIGSLTNNEEKKEEIFHINLRENVDKRFLDLNLFQNVEIKDFFLNIGYFIKNAELLASNRSIKNVFESQDFRDVNNISPQFYALCLSLLSEQKYYMMPLSIQTTGQSSFHSQLESFHSSYNDDSGYLGF